MSVTIVGLGPADGRYLTREAWEVLAAAEAVYLRTAQHPAAADLPPGVATMSFDHVYETAADFDQAYQTICDEVMRLGRRAAERGATLVYAVPGHPLIGESTTTAILAAGRAEGLPVRVVAGLSFIEPTLSALGLDGLEGLQLFDAIEVAGYNHPPLNTDRPALLGQVYSRRLANELKLALMAAYPDEHPVVLIHAAGSDAQLLEHVPLFAIDRSPQLAHLSSLYLPPRPEASGLTALAETVATLRAPEGCPWDREQTRESLAPHLLEEVGEFLASVESGEAEAICDELGDVLGHVVMQAQMAAEQG
ncbi:MAG: SAM-dependent methyltransferase, partial [Candidatus Promineifilaceae bacterium]